MRRRLRESNEVEATPRCRRFINGAGRAGLILRHISAPALAVPLEVQAQELHFDVASVKVVDREARPTGDTVSPGRIHLGARPMLALLVEAYDLPTDQIYGPAWIGDFLGPDRYLIDATMPPATTKEQLGVMLQNLLAERFHLSIHRETRDFPGYDLVVAKDGPKFKESTPNLNLPPPDAARQRPKRGADGTLILPPGPYRLSLELSGVGGVQLQEQPIRVLTEYLGGALPRAFGNAPMDPSNLKPRVADKTGLAGKYDLILKFACEGCKSVSERVANLPLLGGRGQGDPAPTSEAGPNLPNLFQALEQQLGIRLEKTKGVRLEVIVVDHVDKAPVSN